MLHWLVVAAGMFGALLFWGFCMKLLIEGNITWLHVQAAAQMSICYAVIVLVILVSLNRPIL